MRIRLGKRDMEMDGKFLKSTITQVGIALLIGVLILQVIKPIVVSGHSMEPTLHGNDFIFLNKKAYLFHEPEHGDIVVLHSALKREDGQEKLLVKRIVGLPGDRIAIREGKVIRNGVTIEEAYTLDGFTTGSLEETKVPQGCVFVLGDNRQDSADSRDSRVGFLSLDQVVGKAVLRVFPLTDFGTLN